MAQESTVCPRPWRSGCSSVRARSIVGVIVLFYSGCSETGERVALVDELPRIEVAEEVRIGSVDDPDVGFSSIGGISVDRDGSAYVFDRRDVAIRVYDASGALLSKFGGPGEGPGEFRTPTALGFRADTLWVVDIRLRRISLFSRSGEFIRSMIMPSVPFSFTSEIEGQLIAAGLRPDGLFDSSWMVPVMRDMPRDSFWVPHVRLNSAGTIVDTVQLQRFGFGSRRETITLNGREISMPAGPADEPLWVDSRDESYLVERPISASGDVGAFTVTRISGIADTLFTRQYLYHPLPFERSATEAAIASAVARYQSLPGVDTAAVAAAFRRDFVAPTYHPPVDQARVGADGVLWLRREDDGGATRRWLLLGPDGDAQGIIELPRETVVHWSDESVFWAAEQDEFDIPWLVKYRRRASQ